MGFIKRHPLAIAICSFLLLALPGAADTYLSLWDKLKLSEKSMLGIDLGWIQWLPYLVGCALLLIVVYQTRQSRNSRFERAWRKTVDAVWAAWPLYILVLIGGTIVKLPIYLLFLFEILIVIAAIVGAWSKDTKNKRAK